MRARSPTRYNRILAHTRTTTRLLQHVQQTSPSKKRPTPAAEGGSLPLPPANPFAGVELSAAEPAANPFANVQLTAAAANPFANLELVPAKAQKTSAQSNPFASVQLFAPPAAAPAADPDLALRERMQCVRRARLAML